MTVFHMSPRVGEQDYQSAALGVNPAGKFTDADKNKAVKLIASGTYGLVAAGDELEAVVESLNPNTVNNGFSFGTISMGGRYAAKVDNAIVVIGDTMVAGAQNALGTPQANVIVRKGAPTKFKWRVVDLLSGAGAIGSLVIIEKF